MKTIYRTLAATAVLSCMSAGLFAAVPANAMPSSKHTLKAPIAQQVHFKHHSWKKKRHCRWEKRVRWHKWHRHVKLVKVCR